MADGFYEYHPLTRRPPHPPQKSLIEGGAIRILPGQYLDKETNLFYNMARDYDPGTGRYVQPDPLGVSGLLARRGVKGATEPQAVDMRALFGRRVGSRADELAGTGASAQQSVAISPNLYLYAEGNPLGKSDPDGLVATNLGLAQSPSLDAAQSTSLFFGAGFSTPDSGSSTPDQQICFFGCVNTGYIPLPGNMKVCLYQCSTGPAQRFVHQLLPCPTITSP